MNDRDCESCKKFSRNDSYESEGYCQAKRSWVDPQEGEDCKMHEFTLHSATKYKDGTPIMSEPEKIYCESDIENLCVDVEDLQRKVAAIYQFLNSVAPGTFFEIMEDLKKVEKENIHNGSDFCGNCTHCSKHSDDTVYICTLSHGFVDPDDSSCSHFEPPF